jgi:hypothetical protein
MLGRAISETGKKYNVIILAGGAGSRMGTASDFIPKALTKLGNSRAIDYLIHRYLQVADKFIIGTAYHADLLKSYMLGQYGNLNMEFSYEKPEDLQSTAWSTAYCLDHADSRLGTILVWCDLYIASNFYINDDVILITKPGFTKGIVGNFSHLCTYKSDNILDLVIKTSPPVDFEKIEYPYAGILGSFVFGDTRLLKTIIYSNTKMEDFTDDILVPYKEAKECFLVEPVEFAHDFGIDSDLQKIRAGWENA